MSELTKFFKKIGEHPEASFGLSRERVRKPVDRLQIAPSAPSKPKAEATEKAPSKSNIKSNMKSKNKGESDTAPRPGDRGFDKHDPKYLSSLFLHSLTLSDPSPDSLSLPLSLYSFYFKSSPPFQPNLPPFFSLFFSYGSYLFSSLRPYKEGDVVWAKWGKVYLPARIAKETEPNPAIFRTKVVFHYCPFSFFRKSSLIRCFRSPALSLRIGLRQKIIRMFQRTQSLRGPTITKSGRAVRAQRVRSYFPS